MKHGIVRIVRSLTLPAAALACCLLLPPVGLPAASAARPSSPAASMDTPWGDPVIYEVTDVDGKLVRLVPPPAAEAAEAEERVASGERLAGGAEVRTGWFSSADLEVPRAEARFHLRSRTHARLGSERPGVLLVLDRGRLRALFDELGERLLEGDDGDEPERRIETPSAILAVRGTEYGVAVGRDGTTTLVVFEGVVEVFTLAGPPGPPGRVGPVGPIRVRAGEAFHVRLGQPPGPPGPHGLTRRGWDRGGTPPMAPPGPPGTGPPPQGGEGAKRGQGAQGPPPDAPGPQGPPAAGPQGQQGPPPAGPGQQSPKGPPPTKPGAPKSTGPPPESQRHAEVGRTDPDGAVASGSDLVPDAPPSLLVNDPYHGVFRRSEAPPASPDQPLASGLR